MAAGAWSNQEKRNYQAHQAHQEVGAETDRVARAVVDAGLRVHKALGPGLLESVYEHCLVYELESRSLSLQRQVALPVRYGDIVLDAGYRLDLIVEETVVVEIRRWKV